MSNPEYRWFTSVRPGISYRPGSEEQVSKGFGDAMNAVQEFSQNNPLAAGSALATAFSAAAGAGAWAGIGHLTKLQNQRKKKEQSSDPGPTNRRVLGNEDMPARDVPYLRSRKNKGSTELTEGEMADQKFDTSIRQARARAKKKPSQGMMTPSKETEDTEKSLRVSADFLDTSVARLLKNLRYEDHE